MLVFKYIRHHQCKSVSIFKPIFDLSQRISCVTETIVTEIKVIEQSGHTFNIEEKFCTAQGIVKSPTYEKVGIGQTANINYWFEIYEFLM